MAKMIVGAQLYTVRKFTQTLPDIAETLRKVKAIGYTTVQVSGFGDGLDYREVGKVLADSGLKVVATHVGWQRFVTDLDGLIEQHKLWGCPHPAIGGLFKGYEGLDGVKKFVDELAPIAEKLSAAGMDFSYHNHNHEMAHFHGKPWLAWLYELAPAGVCKAEIDTYWIVAGGGDPAAWIRKCAGREPLLHVKDMIILPDRTVRFAEIGEGNLNWPAILAAAADSGVEHVLVEQDQSYERDPFESLAISYRNLNAMGLR
jgi:sugar phosphate isomerase/epimerase